MIRVLKVIFFFFLISPIAAKAPSEITVEELKGHVYYLASDALQGRKPGTPEDAAAAAYIKDQVTLEPVTLLADNGFQRFEIVTSLQLGEANSLLIGDSTLQVQQDFMPFAFSENGSLDAQVVFVGYGFDIKTDSLTWNDYASVDVAGKWVLLLRGDPEMDESRSPFAPHSGVRNKVFAAKDHGAAGVLVASGATFDAKDELPPLHVQDGNSTTGIPVIQLKKPLADFLLAGSGFTVDSLESRLNERRPNSFALDKKVTATANVKRVTGSTQNIVALLPGSDPVLKDQVVVIGAHYDHLGPGGPDSGSRRPDTTAIHNGADDNASGVALAIELFEKLGEHQKELRRSVLFVAFSAEEEGSLGAKYFVQNPLVDLKKIVFMFNFDMVGRLDSTLSLFGSGTAADLDTLLKQHAEPYDFSLSLSPEGLGPSDHAVFYAEDIPALMFFTGMHDDYHTPEDDADRLNYTGEKTVADYAYAMVLDMANRQTPPVFQLAGPQERAPSRRQYKVTLGIMPDMAGQEKRGLRVDAVMPDRPAFRAGVIKGDIIIAMEGNSVKDVYEYMHRLGGFKAGQRISIEVLRGEEKVILIVEL